MYKLRHLYRVFNFIMTSVPHETGHFIAATAFGKKPSLPRFKIRESIEEDQKFTIMEAYVTHYSEGYMSNLQLASELLITLAGCTANLLTCIALTTIAFVWVEDPILQLGLLLLAVIQLQAGLSSLDINKPTGDGPRMFGALRAIWNGSRTFRLLMWFGKRAGIVKDKRQWRNIIRFQKMWGPEEGQRELVENVAFQTFNVLLVVTILCLAYGTQIIFAVYIQKHLL